jgi:GNAT superfamily N-acetyltransferase
LAVFDDIRQQFFPVQLLPEITLCSEADRAAFYQQIGPLMSQVFTPFDTLGAYVMPNDRWQALSPLRQAFAHTHHEQFILYNQVGDPVGWSYGDMLDSETFFMTNSAILPAYRRRGIYTAFLMHLLTYLAALGYERVTSKHQTNNRAVIIAKLRAGFNILGVDLDERWGAQVELGYFFHSDRQRGYERAFALEAWS